ncbi:MAG: exo-alpha-sialidase [Verrucomicrobia bacterium]|nr:exo-alpha-sialidase [Verrucomicrobiota bacterium]
MKRLASCAPERKSCRICPGLLVAVVVLRSLVSAADPRNFDTGRLIPDESYCDQPYVVVTKDGHWLCTLTTGAGREGAGGQHVVATISADQGRTWSPLIDIEPATGPSASWVVPLLTPGGRVYVFYNYNGDRVEVPPFPHVKHRRDDTLGWYAWKYSDDHGRTWSPRHRLPMPVAEVDRGNEWQGRVQLFWGIDKPVVAGDRVLFGFTRLGGYFQERGEGWFYRSDNVLTELDPAKVQWTLLPGDGHGLRGPAFGSIQEEHNVVPLANGDLFCVWRSETGHPLQAYSRDGGTTWTTPALATYAPGGRRIKTPRACPMLWRTQDGRYLFWIHHNSFPRTGGAARNVGWLSGGLERHGFIHWSQPEPVCYQPDRRKGASYPDLIEWEGRFFLAATNKQEARILELDRDLLEGLWRQPELATVARRGLAVDRPATTPASTASSLPRLPSLLDDHGGFAVELWFQLAGLRAGQVLVDSRLRPDGPGLVVTTGPHDTLVLELTDGRHRTTWTCDPGILTPGRRHQVVFNVDLAPRLITAMVDGVLCDGGDHAQFGYARYADSGRPPTGKEPRDVNAGPLRVRLAPPDGEMHRLRFYDRYLTTSEMVGNFRAGP